MDYTAQLYGDYNNPLYGSLLNSQDSMESNSFFFCSNVSKIMGSNRPNIRGIMLVLWRVFSCIPLPGAWMPLTSSIGGELHLITSTGPTTVHPQKNVGSS